MCHVQEAAALGGYGWHRRKLEDAVGNDAAAAAAAVGYQMQAFLADLLRGTAAVGVAAVPAGDPAVAAGNAGIQFSKLLKIAF